MGFKLVRGAYMEKEAARAQERGYENPIQPNKKSCDKDYDEAIDYCLDHIEKVSICVGTHNEKSSLHCVQRMSELGLENSDSRVYFSQLFGMSDHISFNLSNANYRVAKYLPYGPVSAVVPYLTRRAQENSSVAGQAGRELSLINQELKSR
jgi:proline dehydrogenase